MVVNRLSSCVKVQSKIGFVYIPANLIFEDEQALIVAQSAKQFCCNCLPSPHEVCINFSLAVVLLLAALFCALPLVVCAVVSPGMVAGNTALSLVLFLVRPAP